MGNLLSHTYGVPSIISIIIIVSSSIFLIILKKDKQKYINNQTNNQINNQIVPEISNNNIDNNNSDNNNNINNNNDDSSVNLGDNLKTTDYDIVIDLQSIDTFVIKDACWTVYVNKDLLKNVKEDSPNPLDCLLEGSNKFRTATIIGYFKRGKTFTANLINNINLPSGSKTKTKGLSIYISHINDTLFIDTQGSNTPLPFFVDENENEELKKAYNINQADGSIKLNNLHLARKKATESFIQETAISLSNVVIFVVNEMTWHDQQNIMAIQKKIKTQNPIEKQKIRELYVFHNYMNISNMVDLMAMIKTYVTTPFKGYFHTEFSHHSDNEYIIYYTDAENFTTHFFLCNHGSEFGKKWNELVGKFVKTKIKNVTNQNYAFDTILLETLKEKMKTNIKNPTDLKIVPYYNYQTQVVEIENDNNNNKSSSSTRSNTFVYTRQTGIPLKDQKTLEGLEEMFNQVKAHTIDINQVPMYSIVPAIKNNEYEQWKYALNNKDIIFIDNLLIVTGSFNPTYDSLECENRTLIFTFDLPDIPESHFSHSIYYDPSDKVRYLKVSGNRKLSYRALTGTRGGDSTINEYPSAGVKIGNSLNLRKDGEFDLRIPIEANYSKNYSNHFENGVLTLTFKEEIEGLPDESCK
ncbi:hypothetical protein ACTFIW_009014 [Dictyostelium discoideum]